MPLHYDEELTKRLSRLVAELGELGSVTVLGFSGAPELVEKALAHVSREKRWAYADLRGLDAAGAAKALAPLATKAGALVLAVRPQNLRQATASLVGAVLDERLEVDLGEGKRLARGVGQSLFLLVEGCPPFSEAPAALQRAPYWDVIP